MKKSIVISLLTFTVLVGTALCSFASTGIVTTDTLRLRKEASANASIVELLSMNDKVEILEENDGWYKVKAGDKIGYVSSEYIKKDVTDNTETDKVNEEKDNTEENGASSEEKQENTQNKKIIKTLQANVNVYITPILNSMVLSTVKEEITVNVNSEVNGWAYIVSESVKGWVRTENIVEKEVSETEVNNNSSLETGYIIGNSVNFREEANTSSNVITKLKKNVEVKVIEKSNGWAKIQYNDQVGYVSSQYVSNKKAQTTSRSMTKTNTQTQVQTETPSQENTNKPSETEVKAEETVVEDTNQTETEVNQVATSGADIVAYARKYLGSKYVYGGSSPKGFDCSGFTQYVYSHFGYSLSRSSSAQSSNGRAVNKADMQAGDIICFSNSSNSKSIGHVGMYIGGGQFIHAANSRKGVIISNVDGDGFYYVCSRRIIN